jgi:glycosyltransferase involved in cell wall biosynthesis
MQKFRFHVTGLPHTQTVSDEFSWCAFTQKTRRFCDMMMSLGHEVFLYAGEENDAACTELIPCITRAEQDDLFPEMVPEFDSSNPGFKLFNERVVEEVRKREEPKDFLCIIGGSAQAPIAIDLIPMLAVEFGVGYPGVFAQHKVFESYAWMHMVYGANNTNPGTADGQFYDAVIPNYFEADAFPEGKGDGDYLLYMGRLVHRKGVHLAVNAAKLAGKRIILAGGIGDVQTKYGEYVGIVGPEERARLMGAATALIAPTIYVEPFGGVTVEAMLTGTPVITTDWGAFPENVEQGVTGYRARTMGEFVWAAKNVGKLDRGYIRERALGLWSMDVVKWQYQDYFERMYTLWEDGFYDKAEREPGGYRANLPLSL